MSSNVFTTPADAAQGNHSQYPPSQFPHRISQDQNTTVNAVRRDQSIENTETFSNSANLFSNASSTSFAAGPPIGSSISTQGQAQDNTQNHAYTSFAANQQYQGQYVSNGQYQNISSLTGGSFATDNTANQVPILETPSTVIVSSLSDNRATSLNEIRAYSSPLLNSVLLQSSRDSTAPSVASLQLALPHQTMVFPNLNLEASIGMEPTSFISTGEHENLSTMSTLSSLLVGNSSETINPNYSLSSFQTTAHFSRSHPLGLPPSTFASHKDTTSQLQTQTYLPPSAVVLPSVPTKQFTKKRTTRQKQKQQLQYQKQYQTSTLLSQPSYQPQQNQQHQQNTFPQSQANIYAEYNSSYPAGQYQLTSSQASNLPADSSLDVNSSYTGNDQHPSGSVQGQSYPTNQYDVSSTQNSLSSVKNDFAVSSLITPSHNYTSSIMTQSGFQTYPLLSNGQLQGNYKSTVNQYVTGINTRDQFFYTSDPSYVSNSSGPFPPMSTATESQISNQDSVATMHGATTMMSKPFSSSASLPTGLVNNTIFEATANSADINHFLLNDRLPLLSNDLSPLDTQMPSTTRNIAFAQISNQSNTLKDKDTGQSFNHQVYVDGVNSSSAQISFDHIFKMEMEEEKVLLRSIRDTPYEVSKSYLERKEKSLCDIFLFNEGLAFPPDAKVMALAKYSSVANQSGGENIVSKIDPQCSPEFALPLLSQSVVDRTRLLRRQRRPDSAVYPSSVVLASLKASLKPKQSQEIEDFFYAGQVDEAKLESTLKNGSFDEISDLEPNSKMESNVIAISSSFPTEVGENNMIDSHSHDMKETHNFKSFGLHNDEKMTDENEPISDKCAEERKSMILKETEDGPQEHDITVLKIVQVVISVLAPSSFHFENVENDCVCVEVLILSSPSISLSDSHEFSQARSETDTAKYDKVKAENETVSMDKLFAKADVFQHGFSSETYNINNILFQALLSSGYGVTHNDQSTLDSMSAAITQSALSSIGPSSNLKCHCEVQDLDKCGNQNHHISCRLMQVFQLVRRAKERAFNLLETANISKLELYNQILRFYMHCRNELLHHQYHSSWTDAKREPSRDQNTISHQNLNDNVHGSNFASTGPFFSPDETFSNHNNSIYMLNATANYSKDMYLGDNYSREKKTGDTKRVDHGEGMTTIASSILTPPVPSNSFHSDFMYGTAGLQIDDIERQSFRKRKVHVTHRQSQAQPRELSERREHKQKSTRRSGLHSSSISRSEDSTVQRVLNSNDVLKSTPILSSHHVSKPAVVMDAILANARLSPTRTGVLSAGKSTHRLHNSEVSVHTSDSEMTEEENGSDSTLVSKTSHLHSASALSSSKSRVGIRLGVSENPLAKDLFDKRKENVENTSFVSSSVCANAYGDVNHEDSAVTELETEQQETKVADARQSRPNTQLTPTPPSILLSQTRRPSTGISSGEASTSSSPFYNLSKLATSILPETKQSLSRRQVSFPERQRRQDKAPRQRKKPKHPLIRAAEAEMKPLFAAYNNEMLRKSLSTHLDEEDSEFDGYEGMDGLDESGSSDVSINSGTGTGTDDAEVEVEDRDEYSEVDRGRDHENSSEVETEAEAGAEVKAEAEYICAAKDKFKKALRGVDMSDESKAQVSNVTQDEHRDIDTNSIDNRRGYSQSEADDSDGGHLADADNESVDSRMHKKHVAKLRSHQHRQRYGPSKQQHVSHTRHLVHRQQKQTQSSHLLSSTQQTSFESSLTVFGGQKTEGQNNGSTQVSTYDESTTFPLPTSSTLLYDSPTMALNHQSPSLRPSSKAQVLQLQQSQNAYQLHHPQKHLYLQQQQHHVQSPHQTSPSLQPQPQPLPQPGQFEGEYRNSYTIGNTYYDSDLKTPRIGSSQTPSTPVVETETHASSSSRHNLPTTGYIPAASGLTNANNPNSSAGNTSNYIMNSSSSSRRKRFVCPNPGCGKAYLSRQSLSTHKRLKHTSPLTMERLRVSRLEAASRARRKARVWTQEGVDSGLDTDPNSQSVAANEQTSQHSGHHMTHISSLPSQHQHHGMNITNASSMANVTNITALSASQGSHASNPSVASSVSTSGFNQRQQQLQQQHQSHYFQQQHQSHYLQQQHQINTRNSANTNNQMQQYRDTALTLLDNDAEATVRRNQLGSVSVDHNGEPGVSSQTTTGSQSAIMQQLGHSHSQPQNQSSTQALQDFSHEHGGRISRVLNHHSLQRQALQDQNNSIKNTDNSGQDKHHASTNTENDGEGEGEGDGDSLYDDELMRQMYDSDLDGIDDDGNRIFDSDGDVAEYSVANSDEENDFDSLSQRSGNSVRSNKTLQSSRSTTSTKSIKNAPPNKVRRLAYDLDVHSSNHISNEDHTTNEEQGSFDNVPQQQLQSRTIRHDDVNENEKVSKPVDKNISAPDEANTTISSDEVNSNSHGNTSSYTESIGGDSVYNDEDFIF